MTKTSKLLAATTMAVASVLALADPGMAQVHHDGAAAITAATTAATTT